MSETGSLVARNRISLSPAQLATVHRSTSYPHLRERVGIFLKIARAGQSGGVIA
jgi:hypothetical protein